MDSFCSNCDVYNWPSEDVPLLRCSNCKYLYYCSPECQREHWKKVHKKQCKILAGQAIPASVHLPDSCPGCKEEMELGTETIYSPECPIWGCLVGSHVKDSLKLDLKFPSAVDSGEVTRKFSTRDEHTLFVMQQIVHKFIRSNSRQSQECRTELNGLAVLLHEQRMEYIRMHHILPVVDISLYREKLDAVLSLISTISSTLGNTAGDPFYASETLKLLACFLLTIPLYKQTKDFERLGMKDDIPSEVQDKVGKLGTSTQFEEIWDNVLEALKAGLVHHYNLLDILCGGTRNQVCDQCDKSVIIERVFIPYGDLSRLEFEKPSIAFRGGFYSCSAVDCQKAIRMKAAVLLLEVNSVIASKVGGLGRGNMCDYCLRVGRNIHRCSQCKTKVYCSKECQLEDWNEVHEKICNKGDVARKIKGDGMERAAARKEQLDEYMDSVVKTNDTLAKIKEDTVAEIKEDTVAEIKEDTLAKMREDTVAKIREDTVANIREDTVAKMREDTVAKMKEDTGK